MKKKIATQGSSAQMVRAWIFKKKYDLPKTVEILHSIKNGMILIHSKYVNENSALSKPILDYNSTFSSNPVTLYNIILLLIK